MATVARLARASRPLAWRSEGIGALRPSLQLRRPLPPSRGLFAANTHAVVARGMHVRALSFSSVPRAALRAFRVPAYAFGAAGGALAYANYKVDGK